MRALMRVLRPVMAVAGLLLIWWALRPRPTFVVRIGDGGVEIAGRLPKLVRQRMVQFFREEISGLEGVTIQGRPRGNGTLVLRIDPRVNEVTELRIRSFLESIF